jgi:hypothetical protein
MRKQMICQVMWEQEHPTKYFEARSVIECPCICGDGGKTLLHKQSPL